MGSQSMHCWWDEKGLTANRRDQYGLVVPYCRGGSGVRRQCMAVRPFILVRMGRHQRLADQTRVKSG